MIKATYKYRGVEPRADEIAAERQHVAPTVCHGCAGAARHPQRGYLEGCRQGLNLFAAIGAGRCPGYTPATKESSRPPKKPRKRP